MKTHHRVLILLAGPLAGVLWPNVAPAQTRIYVSPPRYVYATPAPRYAVRQAPPRYIVRPAAPRYGYAAPQPMIRYVAPTGSFQRYRRAVDSGRDPNWATGRGVPYYKPWEY